MQGIRHFNRSEVERCGREVQENYGGKLKYDPATTPADCRAVDVFNHHHYFTLASNTMCPEESDRRREKMDKYLRKLPLKQAMEKARADDKLRVRYTQEDKIHNRLEVDLPPPVTLFQKFWTSAEPVYKCFRSMSETEFQDFAKKQIRSQKSDSEVTSLQGSAKISHPRAYSRFHSASRILFAEVEKQPKYKPGAYFSAKVVHINGPQDFFIIPSGITGPSGLCDGHFVDRAFSNLSGNENYSYLIESREGNSVKFEEVCVGLDHRKETTEVENDAESPSVPTFPCLGEKDKLFYYNNPGYLDLYRRDVEARDIHKEIIAKKIADSWRIDYFSRIIKHKVLPERFETIAAEAFLGDIPHNMKEQIEEKATEAFFSDTILNKNQIGLVQVTQLLSAFFERRLEDTKTESTGCFPFSLLEYKAKDGYVVDEVVAVFVQFEMLPVEKALYGLQEKNGFRRGWLRGRVTQLFTIYDQNKPFSLEKMISLSQSSEGEHADDYKVYVVELLDYGAQIHVSDKFILRLPKQFAKLPPIAYRCCLYKLRQPSTFDSKQGNTKFLDLVNNKLLSVSIPCLSPYEDTGNLGVFLSLQDAAEFTDIAEELARQEGDTLDSIFSYELDQRLKGDYGLTREELWTYRAFGELNKAAYALVETTNTDEESKEENTPETPVDFKPSNTFMERTPEHVIDWKLWRCLKAKADLYPAWIEQWMKHGVHPYDIISYDTSLYKKPHKAPKLSPEEVKKEGEKNYKEQAEFYLNQMRTRFRMQEEEEDRQRQRFYPENKLPHHLLDGHFYYEWRERQLNKR